MSQPQGSHIVPSAEQLRALTHPLRVRLLGLLRADGPQTSADLARRTGLNTGATSYHLRMLAQYGFIEDAPELSHGRKRYWRARHAVTEIPPDGDDEPGSDERAAYLQTYAATYTGNLQAAVQERSELPQEWGGATELNDLMLRVTPAQARRIRLRIERLLDELVHRYPVDGPAEPDSEVYVVGTQTFPLPGRLPHRDEP